MWQPFRFQGQYFDEETGLHYIRYRYYDPDTARYLTQVPIGLAGGFHVYSYIRNPTGRTDALDLSGSFAQRRNKRRAQAKSGNVTCPTSCPVPVDTRKR